MSATEQDAAHWLRRQLEACESTREAYRLALVAIARGEGLADEVAGDALATEHEVGEYAPEHGSVAAEDVDDEPIPFSVAARQDWYSTRIAPEVVARQVEHSIRLVPDFSGRRHAAIRAVEQVVDSLDLREIETMGELGAMLRDKRTVAVALAAMLLEEVSP